MGAGCRVSSMSRPAPRGEDGPVVRAPPGSLSTCNTGCAAPRTANETSARPHKPGGQDPALLGHLKELPALRTWSSKRRWSEGRGLSGGSAGAEKMIAVISYSCMSFHMSWCFFLWSLNLSELPVTAVVISPSESPRGGPRQAPSIAPCLQ